MYRLFPLVMTFLMSALHSDAKKHKINISSAQTSFMVGIYRPVTKFNQVHASAFLIDYSDYSFSFQPLCLAVTFSSHIGLELLYQPCVTLGNGERKRNFEQLVLNEFGNNYFVSFPNHSVLDEKVSPIHRVFFGLFYSKKISRFLFQPKIGIGATSFYSKSTSLYLKEKNTNQHYRVEYDSRDHSVDRFTLTAGGYLGFHLSKSVLLGSNFSLSRFKPIINYSETITDIYTEKETLLSYTTYDKSIWNAGLNLGITFFISKSHRKTRIDKRKKEVKVRK